MTVSLALRPHPRDPVDGSAATDPPVIRRLQFQTADVPSAQRQVARLFGDHDLRVSDDGSLDLKVDMALAPRLTLGRMSFGTDTVLAGPATHACYQVSLPLSGGGRASQSGVTRESRAGQVGIALIPDRPFTLTWGPDEDQYVLQIRKAHLEAHAAKLVGRAGEPLDFDLTFDLSSSAAQALLATASFVHAEMIRPGGVSTLPAACHDLESALMTQLLLVVPSQISPLLYAEPPRTCRPRVRAVLDLIDADPTSVLTTADLAAKSGMSARALQAAFQDVVGVTPTAYLRGVRLDRVHYDLLSGIGASVTEVAMRWGFYHPSRFARQYKDRFGNLPSETARLHRNSIPRPTGRRP